MILDRKLIKPLPPTDKTDPKYVAGMPLRQTPPAYTQPGMPSPRPGTPTKEDLNKFSSLTKQSSTPVGYRAKLVARRKALMARKNKPRRPITPFKPTMAAG